MKRFFSILLSISMILGTIATVAADEETSEKKDVVISIEAEDGNLSKNFRKRTSEFAAGSALIEALTSASKKNVAATTVADAEYKFELEAADKYTLYIRCIAPNNVAKHMFAAIDGGEYEICSSKKSLYWVWQKINLGTISEGEHVIRLLSGEKGLLIDRLVLTNNKSYNPDNSLNPTPVPSAAAEVQYLQTKPAFERVDAPVMEEDVPGSFMFEAEDGKIVAPMNINDDKTASGGKYIAAVKGSKKIEVAEANQTVHARYKLNITEKGKYQVWFRIITPDPKAKSSWAGFDKENYTQLSSSTNSDWKWVKVLSANLDVGCHLFNVKYRESGQKIDNIIITNNLSFTPKGLGSCPGEEERASIESDAAKLIPKVYIGDSLVTFNPPSYLDEGVPMVRVRQVMNILGVDMIYGDGYYLFKRDRDYVKLTPNSNLAIVNGKAVEMLKPAVLYENVALMCNMESILDVFKAQYSYDAEKNTINITDNYKENYRMAEEGEFEWKSFNHSGIYRVYYNNPSARVEAWARQKGKKYWKPSYPSRYVEEKGCFEGSFSRLTQNKNMEFKVRIVDGDKEDIFIAEAYHAGLKVMSHEEYIYKPDGIMLIPTINNISYYVDGDSADHICEVQFREKDGEWQDAFTPYTDKKAKQFRGTITNLKADTEYEVKASIYSGKSLVKEVTNTTKTWTENPPIGKTLELKDIYSGSGPLVLQGVHGSDDGYIKIVSTDGMIIDAGINCEEAVYVSDSSHIIFEGLTVKGGAIHGFNLLSGSNNIRIINCDISGFGRVGAQSLTDGRYQDFDASNINNDAGVKIAEVSNILVERCYIHDPRGRSQAWKGTFWTSIHPAGPNAIHIRGMGGIVIRYNDFIGSDEHRWNDCIESYYNGERTGGPGKDCDIHGNMMMLGQDDGIELDGGQMNVRLYENRIEGFYCGISTAPILVGPSYLFRNVVTNLGDEGGSASVGIKNGGGTTYSLGREYIFNNTFDHSGRGIQGVGYGNDADRKKFLCYSRNNIIVADRSSADENAIGDMVMTEENDFDYDLLGNRLKDGIGGVVAKKGSELHGISGVPSYVAHDALDFRLADGSKGIDSGEYLPNFSDGHITGNAPDMGAMEQGGHIQFIPYRPIALTADKYQLKFSKTNTTAQVTVTAGELDREYSFALRTNEANDWISLKAVDGKNTIAPGETVTVEVTVDPSKIDYKKGNGNFLFRLDNGFSIPVSVYCTL